LDTLSLRRSPSAARPLLSLCSGPFAVRRVRPRRVAADCWAAWRMTSRWAVRYARRRSWTHHDRRMWLRRARRASGVKRRDVRSGGADRRRAGRQRSGHRSASALLEGPAGPCPRGSNGRGDRAALGL